MWKEKLNQLEEAGWSQAKIAERIGVTQGYISQLKNGVRSEPKYGVGQKLIALHTEVFPIEQVAA